MSRLAENIVVEILDDMCSRGGGDEWWGGIEEDIQVEIRREWEEIVDNVIKNATGVR